MGKKWKQWQILFWGGSKITADGEIKRCLLLGRKSMTNIDSILEGRDIVLLTKVHLVIAMVFPLVMYGCDSWTVKKKNWALKYWFFELWCWRRLFRVTWTARESNQSILSEISPNIHWKDWCWSWNSKFGHLMWWTLEKTLMLERLKARREGGNRRWDGWMVSPTRWTWVWASSGSWWWTGKPGMWQSIGLQRDRHD